MQIDEAEELGHSMVAWTESYVTHIEKIDRQHKKLIALINRLYEACIGASDIEGAFKKALHEMVEYVRLHFSDEIAFLEKIGYPKAAVADHKRKHDKLVEDILHAGHRYCSGEAFVPNKFARTLRDWVLSHIAFDDKAYAIIVARRRRNGETIDCE